MPIDTSIYGQFTRPIKSVDEYSADADAREAGRLQLLLQRGQVNDRETTRADQQRLLNTLRGLPVGAGVEDVASVYERAGMPEQADKVRKSALERDKLKADIGQVSATTGKTNADADKTRIANGLERIAVIGQLTAGVKDQATYDQARRLIGQQFPDLAQHMQPTFDPEQVAAGRARAMSLKDQLEQEWKAKGYALDVRKADETERNNRAQVGATLRGQNLVDARSREATAASVTKPFEVTGPDGVPMLVQQDRQGNLRKVEGFGPKAGTAKPMTEGQAKANLFGTRAQEADRILADLAAAGTDRPGNIKSAVESIPVIGGVAGSLLNFTQSEPQQQVEQAQRDFINAVLRRESGAAIADSEFENARKQYFPQVNDGEKVKAQKARNRQVAIQGILAEVPTGSRGVTLPAKAAGPALDMPAGPNAGAMDLFKAADAILGRK